MIDLEQVLQAIKSIESDLAVSKSKLVDAETEHSSLKKSLEETYSTSDVNALKAVIADKEKKFDGIVLKISDTLKSITEEAPIQ